MARARTALAVLCLLAASNAGAAVYSGTVKSEDGAPLASVFCGLLSPQYQMLSFELTDGEGAFQITAEGEAGFLIVQPPAVEFDGIEAFKYQPRVYAILNEEPLEIRLPQSGSLVFKAYDAGGNLMRWEDLERWGVFGNRFFYGTDLAHQIRPHACWPVHDAYSRERGNKRETGLPALVAAPGEVWAVHFLFWEVPGYGKLLLSADNGGNGYRLEFAGETLVLNANVELARTAVADLQRRRPHYPGLAGAAIDLLAGRIEKLGPINDDAQRAMLADAILADALRIRDDLEYASAKAAIPALRQGRLNITLSGPGGQPVADAEITVIQKSNAFGFGVFEGSPYDERAAKAFSAAKKAGFNLATVLLGWDWTQVEEGKTTPRDVDKVAGISALRNLGYEVKAHGAVWLQEYGILPEYAKELPHRTLAIANVAHEAELLRALGEHFSIWEAMNEAATTNAVGMPRDLVIEMIEQSASAIQKHSEAATLVNGPHEVDYGRKYETYGPNNQPLNDYNLTYSDFMQRAAGAGALDEVETLGLQFYPGHHFNESLGSYDGPGYTQGWLIDLIERYKGFGKPIHITEMSMPSSYGEEWKSGYWRGKWTEELQAEYAVRAFTIAFGTPGVESITWWDVSDEKPSVITGGLIREDGSPKPAFERLAALIAEWNTNETATSGSDGTVSISAFAGKCTVRVRFPGGGEASQTVTLSAGEDLDLELKAGSSS